MGIDITQWRIEIAKYWRYAGRRRHSRGKSQGVKTASPTSCNPLLAMILSFCLITAPSLLLVAGDVERNPGPPKAMVERPESKVIQKNSVKIAESISGLHLVDWFAAKLAGNSFIANTQQFTMMGVAPFRQVNQMLEAVQSRLKTTDMPAETLKSFIGILQDSPVLQDLTKQLIADYEIYRGTALQSYASNSASGSSSGAGPAVISRPVAFAKTNLSKIQGKFGKLVRIVQTKFQIDSELNKDDLLLFLGCILSPEVMKCLPQSSDLKDIFKAIAFNKLWSFLDYNLLEQIIEEFWESDQELTGRMEQYKADLSGYQTATKLKDHIAAALQLDAETSTSTSDSDTHDPEYLKELSIKLDEPFSEYTLDYLFGLWTSLERLLRLPPLTLLLHKIHKGCICVTWLIPTHLTPQATEKARQSVKFFEDYPILRVIINDELVFEVKPIVLGQQGKSSHVLAKETELQETGHRQSGEYTLDAAKLKSDRSSVADDSASPQSKQQGNIEKSPPADDSELTEKDTRDVFDEVESVAANWQGMAIRLGLLPSDRDIIAKQCQQNPTNCLLEVLVKWLRKSYDTIKFGPPTWKILIDAVASHAGGDNPALAEEIERKHQGKTATPQPANPSSGPSNVVPEYAVYLRRRYKIQIPSFFTLQWPPPPTQTILRLAMIRGTTMRRGSVDEAKVRLILLGKVDDIVYQKQPVELKDIFELDNTERKVILIEGAPGAGKSTLAWNICQKWGAQELFSNFRTVVFIQLRDPAIQSAKSVEDILPATSREQAKNVLAEINFSRGKDLLFVMDGWDELPLQLQTSSSSIFKQLVVSPQILNLDLSTVVVTSRPIATGDLCQNHVISSCVEILGFTPTEVKTYLTEALKGDSEAVQKLQDKLKERPMIEASCYLPLNAAIVCHLFLAHNQKLPNTLHGVFTSLVICCLIRDIKKDSQKSDILSFTNLPSCLVEPFKNICSLAYHGVRENKATYSEVDLNQFELPKKLETLGLIQGVESFMSFQKSVTYNFLHLSVQELLASFHISQLSDKEQVKIFKELFDQPRFASVFQFYAAFTKFKTEGIREIVANIVKKKKDKPQLVQLLHGLYEAQDLSLCQFVISKLGRDLNLYRTSLSPVDCISIGYFLCCVCSTLSGEFVVTLRLCSLDCDRINFLMNEFSKSNSSSTEPKTTVTDVGVPCKTELSIDLWHNKIADKGLQALCEILMVNKSLKILNLRENQVSDAGAHALSEALKVNKSLRVINLANTGISDVGGKELVDALKYNDSLQELQLWGNLISDKTALALGEALKVNRGLRILNLKSNLISAEGATMLARALDKNKSLETLEFQENGADDKGALAMAEALRVNHSLKALDLSDNQINDDGAKALGEALKENKSLTRLKLSDNQISSEIKESLLKEFPERVTF